MICAEVRELDWSEMVSLNSLFMFRFFHSIFFFQLRMNEKDCFWICIVTTKGSISLALKYSEKKKKKKNFDVWEH